MFSPRPEVTRGDAPGSDILRDPARVQRLEAQTERPDAPPADLLPLLQAPLEGARLQQAEHHAMQLRLSPPAEARDVYLYWLTLALYNAYTGPANAIRQRALIETAIELVAAPQRRAVLTGMLARNAARAGELDAASSWLGRMDPASESLVADSAYRLTRGYISTARRDHDDVLMVLGRQIGDVPAAAGDNLMCAVLRANAHECLGHAAHGGAQLLAFIQHDASLGTQIDRIIAANPTLHLCTQSLAMAKAYEPGA